MDLQLTDDQELFFETTSKFLESTCAIATIREWANAEPHGFPSSWWRQGAELGWTSMLVAEEHGGGNVSGNGVADLALVAEELGRRAAPGPLLAVNIVAAALSRFGDDSQRGAWLEGLVSGESFATWALSPSSGPGASGSLRATREGQGLRLDGTVSPVEATDLVGLILVSVELEGAPVNVLVASDSPGLSVEPLVSLDLVKRFGRLRFSDVAVPPEQVLAGDGAAQLEELLDIAAALQSAEISGIADLWLGRTVEYAFDRYTFGRPLASYQALKHRFANLKVRVETMLALSSAAVLAVGSGNPRAAEYASAAKAYAAAGGTDVLQDCVQLHGGIGTTWDHDLHLYIRRATQGRSLYGTADEHRERIAEIIGMGE